MFALKLEGEIIRQVSALMVAAEQPQCVRIPDLQRPQIQNALERTSARLNTVNEFIALTSILK